MEGRDIRRARARREADRVNAMHIAWGHAPDVEPLEPYVDPDSKPRDIPLVTAYEVGMAVACVAESPNEVNGGDFLQVVDLANGDEDRVNFSERSRLWRRAMRANLDLRKSPFKVPIFLDDEDYDWDGDDFDGAA